MGLTYWEKERMDDAYRSFRKAVVIDPGYFSSWFNLGAACRINGNPKKAYLCYKKCLHLNSGSLETAITLANLSIELLKLEDAKLWADRIQQIKPGCEISKQILEQINILSKDL
jgi:tetratricopeptide (TPR) repeat protein